MQRCVLCYVAVPFCRGTCAGTSVGVNLNVIAHDATLNSHTNQPTRRSSMGHKSANRLQACTLHMHLVQIKC